MHHLNGGARKACNQAVGRRQQLTSRHLSRRLTAYLETCDGELLETLINLYGEEDATKVRRILEALEGGEQITKLCIARVRRKRRLRCAQIEGLFASRGVVSLDRVPDLLA